MLKSETMEKDFFSIDTGRISLSTNAIRRSSDQKGATTAIEDIKEEAEVPEVEYTVSTID